MNTKDYITISNEDHSVIRLTDNIELHKKGNYKSWTYIPLTTVFAANDLLEGCKEALLYRKQTHHGDDKLIDLLEKVILKAETL